MKRRNLYTLALAVLTAVALSACSREETQQGSGNNDAVLLTGLSATIQGGTQTRADESTSKKEPYYIGRESFVAGDILHLQKFYRTSSTLSEFSYNNILWTKTTDEGGWTQSDKQKIYWSDATSEHTLVAYSLPYEVKDGFSWTATDGGTGADSIYHGQLSVTQQDDESYVLDYTDPESGTEGKSGVQKMKDDDVVLSYSTSVVPDASGIANAEFRHALACLTIDLNISGFSASTSQNDYDTRVTSVTIEKLPYKYRWNQLKYETEAEDDSTTAVADVKAWTQSTEGTGTNASRQFYYHTLAVPGKRENVKINFTVTYPDPVKTGETRTNTYSATVPEVVMVSGKRTTVKISLDHQNEDMTVGAEIESWQYYDTPDQGSLSKNSTYLSSIDYSNIGLGKSTTSLENATWLYTPEMKLLDIYGHTGTKDDPYTICTAQQLLAFAKEVNNGYSFEGKYVRLDANLYMQPSTSATSVSWIGIGDTEEHSFQGNFDGGLRELRNLKGKPLFGYVGENATIEGVRLYKYLTGITGTTDGGSIAISNAGTISGCFVNGDVTGTTVAGGICAENTGTIIACAHTGGVKCTGTDATAGTIAGSNDNGTITACYAGCGFTGATTVLLQCYYDNEWYSEGTDDDATKYGMSSSSMMLPAFVTKLNDEISSSGKTVNYQFKYQASEYPTIVEKTTTATTGE